MKNIVCLIILSLASCGCATNLRISPVMLDNQFSAYKGGAMVVLLQQENLVTIRALKENIFHYERPTFIVAVRNTTNTPFNFSTENISISVDKNTLKVFSYEELVAEIEAQRRNMAIIAALGALGRTMQANQTAHQYHSGSFDTSYYGPSGYRGHGHGTYSGYTYNPNAALQAHLESNIQTIRDVEFIRANAERQLSNLQNTILRKETVFPGQWFGGYIKTGQFPIPKNEKIVSIEVKIAKEIYRFKFNLSQPKHEK